MPIALIDKDHIAGFIPHKEPMVMIDTLDYAVGDITRTSFKIEDNNLFVKDGILHEPALVENIAQTAAVRAGYNAKTLGAPPLIGFIGSVRDLKIYSLPKVGETITTTVEFKAEVMNVTVIQGTIFCGDKKIMECEMKILLQKS